ncbi:MAG: FAD-dependent oxidoreductase [Ignavibacteriaceae bacterium]|nr:FAD-dependent oxidoreductase [Ignavibacteriaceae bacterium]
MEILNAILNDKIVQAHKGESILDLAKRLNVHIPTLCNDNRLDPFSSCYLCVVEIVGMRSLQPACSTKVNEGMKIYTDNDRVRNSRKTALELLLSNHYADCMAPCRQTCPAGVDVQGYISLINKGLYKEAVALIKEVNPLPAICGRVCVRPCEVACRRNLLEENGVGIDYLKRYASDIDLASDEPYKPELKQKTGKKTAVIGAGPAGLTAAYYLAVEGIEAEIFEASPNPGGMLRYGIPPYRLPNEIIDKEVKNITDLGVKIHYNKKLGSSISYKEIKQNFDSCILTIGSQVGTGIGCENDKAENVLPGIDFLRNMEMTGQHYDFSGKHVGVIGGGNTAMDCCRTSMRCNAEKVYVIYRRTEKEMPANPIEIHESKLEGIEYLFLTAPAKVNMDESGKLKSLSCFKMELGEPDASGRRRPVKIEGSEFEIKLDIILAAIGQKTNVEFLDDLNNNLNEKLALTKWGDIDADKKTLQTSIKNIFAAGDSVTGPATLIQAIAQGRKAARSCTQYLKGLPLTGEPYEFLSKKDNFEKQKPQDYKEIYSSQVRSEMSTLDASLRKNFNEVELGYSDSQAYEETLRCLECGCTEYYTCDLKKYSTEYGAVQTKYGGDYKKYRIDFSHPFIEIDNNKCILCSRCVRICSQVVNANALGLINRGFDTYVAPSGKESLSETECESCGMCISTCPTGAITENVTFKPGPIKTESFNTICNYCSVGCEITIHQKSGFVMRVTGSNGLINSDSNICRFAKFGYNYLNNRARLTAPLLKVNGKFEEITFNEAFTLIASKIKSSKPNENAFYAGARLTNEELFLIQKLAKDYVETDNLSSFHYSGRGEGYFFNSVSNLPLNELNNVNKIYLIGSELNYENPVVGYMINNSRFLHNSSLHLITDNNQNRMIGKADSVLSVKSYYHFIKAVNYYLLKNNMYNALFIKDNVTDFKGYSNIILTADYDLLLEQAGVINEQVASFVNDYNDEIKAVIVFSEKHLSSNTSQEIFNLAMITGKLGKTASGIISLKEKNNSQGLIDMGISPLLDFGGTLNKYGGIITDSKLRNLFIFGEDPMGCAVNKNEIRSLMDQASFRVVSDYFITDTAALADLVLPASLPFEIGGTFTNTQKYILSFLPGMQSKLEKDSCEQLIAIIAALGNRISYKSIPDITAAIATGLQKAKINPPVKKYNFTITDNDDNNRNYKYGCDYLFKYFEDDFLKAFQNVQ